MEEIEIVCGADGEAECVELDLAGCLLVHATDVDGELLVDEDPHVVVTKEAKGLAALVSEFELDLGCEEEIVPTVLRRRVVGVVEAVAVGGKEGSARKGRDVRGRIEDQW